MSVNSKTTKPKGKRYTVLVHKGAIDDTVTVYAESREKALRQAESLWGSTGWIIKAITEHKKR